MSKDWNTIDTEKLLRKRQDQHEQTTSTGVGGYAAPLGGEPMRPAVPEPAPEPKKKQKKQKK